jgi:hypothetical protein
LSEEASRETAKISARLKKSGQQIGIADELIAAIISFEQINFSFVGGLLHDKFASSPAISKSGVIQNLLQRS